MVLKKYVIVCLRVSMEDRKFSKLILLSVDIA